jgi:hypothetical protein
MSLNYGRSVHGRSPVSRDRDVLEAAEAEEAKKKKGQPSDLEKLRRRREESEERFSTDHKHFREEFDQLQARRETISEDLSAIWRPSFADSELGTRSKPD